ncbi:MAG: hypothetical protein O2909_10805 [Chloroflexi bacterium]|nr:hypothetical protein [Chloroflexota bacterium]
MPPVGKGFPVPHQVVITAADSRSLEAVQRRFSEESVSWVYLGQNLTKFYQVKQSFQGRGTQLDTTQQFQQTAQALRLLYLTYLYKMGRELNSLRWWISSLSCRRVDASSKTFHQACYMKLALELLKKWQGPEPLVIVAVDKPVRVGLERNLAADGVRVPVFGSHRSFPFRLTWDTVNMWAHRAFFVFRQSHRVFVSRRMIRRAYMPTEDTTLLISWASSDNLRRGVDFHKSFFGDLAARLGEIGYRVAIVPMILPGVGYKEALFRLRAAGYPVLVPDRYLSFLDLIRAAISSCARPPLPGTIPTFCGMDISSLIREDLRKHWVSNQAMDALLTAMLVRRWESFGSLITRIIYIYENQPWERALCWGARHSLPDTTLVGYQHARLPRLLLNFHLAPAGEDEAPLPDRVVTVGRHTARILSGGGFTAGRVRVGGAIHLQNLMPLRSDGGKSSPSGDCTTVLVACSNSPEEATELVHMATRLFDQDEGVRVVIKCHPIMPFEKVSNSMSVQLPKHVQVCDDPLTELMLQSSVMVYSGSTVCTQALALGLPVVHLCPQFDLDMDPLETVPDLRLEATGLEELRQNVRWLLCHREEYISQHRERWNRFVDEMYGPVTEQTFSAFVE